ncbi:hypothetical protein LCGC14_2866140 [marine sediment metagenome]|uniref:Uncharacterized protein n=1 Tax=marine sediment metagenome TaxID=412755 RepID=A0A0F9ACG2_9ZZZZ
MQTEAVLERYRELKKGGLSALEASIRVHEETGRAGDLHWHRIHEQCWCGYLTVPAAYYTYDDKGRQTNTQEDAEKKYLAELGANKASLQTAANTKLQTCECGKPTRPRGTDCWKCYRERSK